MTKQEGFGRPGVLRADSNASDPVFNFGMPARYGESAQGYVVAKALSLALADPTSEIPRSHGFSCFPPVFSTSKAVLLF